MAKQQGKNITGWSRFRLWVENNQKVVWVLLLLIISPMFAFPVSSFVRRSGEDRVTVDNVFGDRITQADYKKARQSLETVGAITNMIDYNARFSGSPLPGPISRAELLLESDPLAFQIFKRKALQMGLRVTDEELGEHVRELWQWSEAGQLAGAEVASRSPKEDSKDPSANWRRQFEILDLAKKKKAELEAVKAFDGASWARLVEGTGRRAQVGMRVKDFEDVLRDLYLIAKLEDYVRSSVEVTPEEAYEEYRRDSQTRKLSWTEFKASDALKEAVSRAVTDEEVKAYYDAHAEEFEKGMALRAKWLLVPLEHFKAKAAAEITEDDLRKYYEENRNDYRRPTILSGEGSFAVRSQEETAKLREAAFKGLDEVKEKVREDAITKRADADVRAFASQLRTRLYPEKSVNPEEKKAPAASFESLAKEIPFLKTGTPALVSRDEAKDAFGDAYTPQVNSWFTRADSRSGQKASIEAPEFPLQGEKGMVYYGKPEIRERFRPTLKEIEPKVREKVIKSKAADWIADALEGRAVTPTVTPTDPAPVTPTDPAPVTPTDSAPVTPTDPAPVTPSDPAPGAPTDPAPAIPTDPAPATPTDPAPATPTDSAPGPVKEINEGKKTVEQIAAAGIDVKVPAAGATTEPPGAIHLAAEPIGTSSVHVSRRGPLMVPKPKTEAEKDEAKKEEEDPSEKDEIAHPDSTRILQAVFGLEKEGEVSAARSEEEAAAYLVRFDDRIYPDPAGFAAKRESIERELVESKQRSTLTAWRNEVLREARGRSSAPAGGPEKAETPPGTAP